MKKVLLIMPLSHSYYNDLIDTFNAEEYCVDFIPDFDETFLKRSIRYINKPYVVFLQNRYIKKKVQQLKETLYDVVFIVRGYGFSYDSVAYIKQKFPAAHFILYQWDPLSISLFDKSALQLFDKCYSFDKRDCDTSQDMNYLPLFYKDVANCENFNDLDNRYDFAFVGAGHSNRLSILLLLLDSMNKNNYTYYVRVYINRFSYYIGWLLNKPGYRKFPIEFIVYNPVPRKETQIIFKSSKVVIDINHPKQVGLSIRVIEVLSYKKKLLTMNRSIVNEPFYNAKVIGILQNGSLPENINILFNNNDFVDISDLEISNWLKKILKYE